MGGSAPNISTGTFADFATAGASQKLAVVRTSVGTLDTDYAPERDFYKQFRDAIKAGVRSGDDVAQVRRAADRASVRRQDHYRSLSASWNAWRGDRDLDATSLRGTWGESGLTVNVRPTFVCHNNNGVDDLILIHYKSEALNRDAVQAVIRLMELTLPAAAGRPAVLDLRRRRLHHASTSRQRDMDLWLAAEAASFVVMFTSLAQAARAH